MLTRTMVATPAYRGEVVMQYAHSLVRDTVGAAMDGHFVEAPYAINDTYIHNARNQAFRVFLAGESDHLVFIDADMGWEPGALSRLIGMPAYMDVVGAIYTAKEDPPRFPYLKLDGEGSEPVREVAAVPTGFMRITRPAAQRMLDAHPNGRVFDHMVDDDGVEWGDDMAFCRRARAIGLGVWAIFDIEFEHVGPRAWKARAQEHV